MANEQKTLVPIEEKEGDFSLSAALVEVESQSEIFVPLCPICDFLGLAWSGQFERIKRDPVLSEVIRSVRVTRTERGGKVGTRDALSLPLRYLNGWLFGVSAA